MARTFHVYWPKLLWALRIEAGEKTGRLHFHALLGGFPSSVVSEETCFYAAALWRRFGGGWAQMRVFDPAADFAGYTIADSDVLGANIYEGAKFGTVGSPVLLSRSIQAAAESYLRRSSGLDRRHKRSNDGACVIGRDEGSGMLALREVRNMNRSDDGSGDGGAASESTNGAQASAALNGPVGQASCRSRIYPLDR